MDFKQHHIFNLMILQAIRAEVKRLNNPLKASQLMKFFKTGPGQYGEGDIFVGLTNPQSRQIAKNHKMISLEQIEELIESKIHEERFIALVLMNDKYKKGNWNQKETIFKLYMKKMKWVNGWDLVDLSAPNIVGEHLLELENQQEENKKELKATQILYKWSENPSLWFRRISIISTFTFIRANRFHHTIKLSEKLLNDKEDLIHKAVGWMLRQVGKRDPPLLEDFLKHHYDDIPRTALRYSIEKFEEPKRLAYLKGNFTRDARE